MRSRVFSIVPIKLLCVLLVAGVGDGFGFRSVFLVVRSEGVALEAHKITAPSEDVA
jgi:hypothetical protein